MAKLTQKENFMKMAHGEIPEWVPIYTFGMPLGDEPAPAAMIGPSCLPFFRGPGGGKDPWGVTYVTNEETGNAALPEPNNYILEDITKWRDVIKAPDFSNVDWESLAKKDYENSKIDRNKSAVILGASISVFQDLMAFMGFTEGLCAMYEEPEEVMALFEYMTDSFYDFTKNALDYYKPDIFYILDDSAAKENPFISLDMYRKFLKPNYKRLYDLALDRGCVLQFHNCGRCEDFVDDMVDMGVALWDPAQTTNDLVGIQKKYGNKLSILGGWDFKVPTTWPVVDEGEIRQSVRDSINKYAVGGGYAFMGGVLGRVGDELTAKINGWITDEAITYGAKFYK